MRDIEPTIVSFHGADGCGKSTLARAFSRELEATRGTTSVMLGGSSYLDWLTPDIANQTIGPNHHFAEVARTTEEKTRLYGEIAAVCYSYAGHLRNDKGVNVTIDSDPVLKRIIWNRLSTTGDASATYENRFGEYILDNVPETAFPTAIVGVNISGEVDPDDIQARLTKRGGNSEYDPSSIEETQRICEKVTDIWDELQRAKLGLSGIRLFNTRFQSAELVSVTNADCHPNDIDASMVHSSRFIIGQLH